MRHLPAVRQLALDLLGLAGLGAVVVGVHQVSAPAAWIVGGIMLFGGAVAATRGTGR